MAESKLYKASSDLYKLYNANFQKELEEYGSLKPQAKTLRIIEKLSTKNRKETMLPEDYIKPSLKDLMATNEKIRFEPGTPIALQGANEHFFEDCEQIKYTKEDDQNMQQLTQSLWKISIQRQNHTNSLYANISCLLSVPFLNNTNPNNPNQVHPVLNGHNKNISRIITDSLNNFITHIESIYPVEAEDAEDAEDEEDEKVSSMMNSFKIKDIMNKMNGPPLVENEFFAFHNRKQKNCKKCGHTRRRGDQVGMIEMNASSI